MAVSGGLRYPVVVVFRLVIRPPGHRTRRPVTTAAGHPRNGGSVMQQAGLVLGAIGVVCVVTIIISVHGLRRSRTTRDFYVASRRVPPWMNASAIAGAYLTAACFFGVPGLFLSDGTTAT